MTKEEMLQNMNDNNYRGGGSGVAFSNIFLANPIMDSIVVNSYAKTNRAAFALSLNTGAAYSNHTVMGGNFLYNAAYNNKFIRNTLKLGSLKSGSIQPFKNVRFLNKSRTLRNFSLNFISRTSLNGSAAEHVGLKTGLKAENDIIRTGFGFGKDYSGFFDALRDLGYKTDTFDYKTVEKVVHEGFTGTIERKPLRSKPSAKKNVRKGLNKKIKTSNTVNKSSNKSGIEHVVRKEKEIIAGKAWNSVNLSDDLTKIILEGADDKVAKLADEFVNLGGKLTNYVVGSKTVSKEVREELISKAGKMFAGRTMFQKIMSNSFVRVATGAAIALPAAVSIPIAAAAMVVGTTASVGQDNAINNFVNANLYQPKQYDSYSSDEAIHSLQSANYIRDYNLQSLANSLSNHNVANRYLNDMDPISSDYSFDLDDAETM